MRFDQCAARAKGREAGPGLVELVEGVTVDPLDAPVRAEPPHADDGDLERSAVAAPRPPRNDERPTVIEGEAVVRVNCDVGREIDEHADARQVFVTRVQGMPSNRSMVLENDVRVEQRGKLLPVTRGYGSREALQRHP